MNTTSTIKVISCTEAPFMLNGWKHHMGFLAAQIRKWTHKPEQTFPLFVAKLKVLGDSLFDIYTGKLGIDQITAELKEKLVEFNVFGKDAYTRWIESSAQCFWQLIVSDGSEWTMRLGDSEEFYIHIHPARYGLHTERLKANQLRTALATLVLANMRGEQPDMKTLNRVRQQYLGLSQVTRPMAKEIFSLMNDMAKIADVPN